MTLRRYTSDLAYLDPVDPTEIDPLDLQAVNEDTENLDTRGAVAALYDVDRAAARCTVTRGDEISAEDKARILAEVEAAAAFKRRHGGKV